MNDSRFIELLNLYVDHQISAADAAALEAEIQRDTKRRRIYREYCQMQKACTLLADSFRTEAPARSSFGELKRKRPALVPFSLAVGAVAAAACIALVQVVRSPSIAPTSGSAPVLAAAPASRVEASPTTSPASSRVALQPVFAGFETPDSKQDLNFAATQVRLDWMDQVQLRHVTTEELWLQPRPTSQPEDLLFRNPRTVHGQFEMTAWRFQK